MDSRLPWPWIFFHRWLGSSDAALTSTLTNSALWQVSLIERGANAARQLQCIIIGPKVHEEKPRRLNEHVAVHRRHLDAIVAQCANDRVDLAGDQNKISSNSRFTSTRRLEIDSMRNTHRRRDLHVVVHDLFSTRN